MKPSKFSHVYLFTLGLAFMSLSSASYAQSAFPFLEPEFKVPATLETERFRLRMLTVGDVVKDYDAEVYLWARQSELASGMETELAEAVIAWLASDWPFKNAALPGTSISEEEWEKLPELKR